MEGPPRGPGGEDITWPDQVAPRGRKASSTRKIKPQTSNLSNVSGVIRDAPSTFLHSLQNESFSPLNHKQSGFIFRIKICYPDDGKCTGTDSVAGTIVEVLDGSENTLFHHL